jgi:hypothetical protein
MLMQLTFGGKPSPHQGEWGVAMGAQMAFTNRFTASLKCMSILTAHFDKAANEMTGVSEWSVSILGSKNTGKYTSSFSDALWVRRDPTTGEYLWASISPKRPIIGGLKSRNLPQSLTVQPDFQQIIDSYEKRKAFAAGK